MLPLWAIMAAAGVVKDQMVDKPKEERARQLAAQTQRYSPWTHLQAQQLHESSPFDAALQGGMSGLGMQQSMEQAEGQKKMQDAVADSYTKPPGQRPTLYGQMQPMIGQDQTPYSYGSLNRRHSMSEIM